ncbi:hypothetical protein [Acuticoccus mangrovi]|uniref:Tetratricopeptide repeat protein n=1 Tax=Acuticoccus mangrovi TaxID=2796142 RepID=A0A934IMA9_9HYPH|nr:hypothetical protein [Acuticoccus mangrovi]MBJ3774847.1 hypothetical protein [Acuticoccus mangrovi]
MDYYDLGRYGRAISTTAPAAQTWFDRGLVWCYGYNHGEAIAAFRRAAEADPSTAMPHWGIAYATGPNYNLPWALFDDKSKADALAAAHEATQAALARREGASPAERALVEALPARYPQRTAIADQSPWDRAFAEAMRAAYRAMPDDLDVATVFVEALMNLTPWRMWDIPTGTPAEGAATLEAREVLERAMSATPEGMDHPGLLHLYVHLMEMSPFPEKALTAADRLRDIAPDAGHLVHMPTHIDVLCGHYRDVLATNQKAIAADRIYMARNGAEDFYALYRIHNYHFAVYGAMFLGQYHPAIAAADELIAVTPERFLRVESPPIADFMESYLAIRQHVQIRFGKWRELIAEPLPVDTALYANTVATLHYANGVAHAALGEVSAAERERALFLAAWERVPETRLLHNNTCRDLLAVASAMLDGEIAYRRGDHDEAFSHLGHAVALEDGLPYDEPWGWMQPTRHALGALLFEAGRVEAAETVYREDLGLSGRLPRASIHPDNVWSLRGLADCLARKPETTETRLIKQRLAIAAARADVPVRASCFCARSAA